MDKKKTLILSILGVIVLIIAVVGISYAMYTFTGTGSKENVITTGTVSISYNEADGDNITLDNSYSATDGYGTGANNPETLTFSVVSNITGGNTSIGYEVQLVPTEDTVVGGLRDEHIDFNLSKNSSYAIGTATTGVALSTYASTNGSIITSGGYVVASGTFTGTGTDSYVVKAWINDTYNLPTTGTGTCTGGTAPTTEVNCASAHGIWNGTTCSLADSYACVESGGTWTDTTAGTHSNTTAESTFSFKVKIQAAG